MKTRCRHDRNSWLLASGNIEWCFVCGAWRKMGHVSSTEVIPLTHWVKPSHDRDNNPAVPLPLKKRRRTA